MKTNKHQLIALSSSSHSFQLSIFGYQYPDVSPSTIDADWLLFEIDVTTPLGSWTRTDPTELTSRMTDLPDWFSDIADRGRRLPDVYRFTEPTLTFQVREVTPGTLRLLITLAHELVDRDFVDEDEVTFDFSVTPNDLRQIGDYTRESLAVFPPRNMSSDFRFAEADAEATGYWLHGLTIYPITMTHVGAITQEPEVFGLTEAEIADAHTRHDEQIGSAGRASEDLIHQVARDGWIKIRHDTTPRDHWSIQCAAIADYIREITLFVRLGVDVGFIKPRDELRLLGYDDNTERSYCFQDGGASSFIAEHGHQV